MITVTPSLATTTASNLAPTTVVDSAASTTVTAGATENSVVNDIFSAALATQKNNLLGQSSSSTVTPSTAEILAALLNAPTLTGNTAEGSVVVDISHSVDSDILQNATTTKPQFNASQSPISELETLLETELSPEYKAIFSNVSDILEFIATKTKKLGNTLQTQQQDIQAPKANVTTLSLQQLVQSAIPEVVTNAEVVTNVKVNTPAAFITQQVTPIAQNLTEASSIETPITQEQLTTQLKPSVEIIVEGKTAIQPSVVEPNELDEIGLQFESISAEKKAISQTSERPVVIATVQNQVIEEIGQPYNSTDELVITTSEQLSNNIKTESTQQVKSANVSAQPQQDKVVNVATTAEPTQQVKVTNVSAQSQQDNVVNVSTTAEPTHQAKSAQPQQDKMVNVSTTAEPTHQVKSAQPQQDKVVNLDTTSEQTQQVEAVAPSIQKFTTQTNLDNKNNEAPILDSEDLILVAETTPLLNTQNMLVEAKTENSGDLEFKTKETSKKSEHLDVPIITTQQQLKSEVISPMVTAQATPINSEAEKATFETVKQSVVLEDKKTTLTSAKDLIAGIVENRNNATNNGNNSSDGAGKHSATPQPLQTETLFNLNNDNKSSALDTKSFASLLAAEKSENVSASANATTTEKSVPQNISAMVNKLAQDTKLDVPAMTRPLSHPAWNQEMGERIIWMNNQGISSAEIKMNPQNMGPITVRIDMNQDQATIAFTAQNSDVRTALENSIPKLREMLTSQNVNLAEVNVSQQSSTSTNSDSNRQQQTAQMMADASANGQGNRQNNPEMEVDSNGNIVRQASANGEEIAVDEFANGQILETNGMNGVLSVFA